MAGLCRQNGGLIPVGYALMSGNSEWYEEEQRVLGGDPIKKQLSRLKRRRIPPPRFFESKVSLNPEEILIMKEEEQELQDLEKKARKLEELTKELLSVEVPIEEPKEEPPPKVPIFIHHWGGSKSILICPTGRCIKIGKSIRYNGRPRQKFRWQLAV